MLKGSLVCFTGFLFHNGYYLPEYTVISDIALTKHNPLRCVQGKRWIGPDNTIIKCDEPGSSPFNCSKSSDSSSIILYKTPGVSFKGKQLYICAGSTQNISIQIESE